MGTGKSTVGQALASRLGRPFIDLDTEIEGRAGRSIKDIFTADGEAAFRGREADELERHLARTDGVVIALGGGALLHGPRRHAVTTVGHAICLNASLDTLEERLAESRNRPMLQNANLRDSIAELIAARSNAYGDFGVQISTDEQSIDDVVDTICAVLRRAKAA